MTKLNEALERVHSAISVNTLSCAGNPAEGVPLTIPLLCGIVYYVGHNCQQRRCQ